MVSGSASPLVKGKAAFAAIFRSLGLNPSSSPESGSVGVGRSESGRFASVGLRGLRVGKVTGEGEREGSFSAFSSFSGSESSSGGGWSGMGAEMERGEGWVRWRGVGFFMVTLEVLAGLLRGRAGRRGGVG